MTWISLILAKIGLDTLKKQIVAAAIAIAIVVIPVMFKVAINSWRSDIAAKATGEVTKKVQDKTIETLKRGKKVDEKILNSDDDELCNVLGGCL